MNFVFIMVKFSTRIKKKIQKQILTLCVLTDKFVQLAIVLGKFKLYTT